MKKKVNPIVENIEYEVIKLAGTPDETSWFDRMRIDAFNEQARNVTSSIHNAIAEAVNKGMELEAVFFGGKFAEMSGKPSFTYKIECHNSEDVMVGGTMTFAQDQPGSMLTVSEQEVALRGAGGYNGASHYMNEELDRPMIDALVAFFSRCYKKRL